MTCENPELRTSVSANLNSSKDALEVALDAAPADQALLEFLAIPLERRDG